MHWYTTQLHPYTLPCSIFSTDSPSLFIISSGLQCSNEHINCKIIVWRSIYPTTTLLRSTEIESWRTKIIISKNRDINEVTVSKVPCIFSQTTKIIKLEQCSDSCTVFGHCQQRSIRVCQYVLVLDGRLIVRLAYAQRRTTTHRQRLCVEHVSIILSRSTIYNSNI